ncbi:MAG: type II secretion system protein [Kiritimatiellae bacterium]|nr:type II secretion system protein [Kiritimatiellia bacterium]
MKRKGFTLVEMLVVIAIVATLMGATIAAVSKFLRSAEKARCQELAANTATALSALYVKEGLWPRALVRNHNSEQGLDEKAALPLAKHDYMSLTMNDAKTQLSGYDRFGIVSPWALKVIKRKGTSASASTPVPGGGTIRDHVFRYAIDLNGDGVIPGVQVGGQTIDIRATAAVWCCGKDGRIEAYSTGLKKDDVYSWTIGQTREVQR